MTKLIRALGVATAAILLATASAIPAQAATTYKWIACTTSVGSYEVAASGNGERLVPSVYMRGTINACQQPTVAQAFALAAYTSAGIARGIPFGYYGGDNWYPGFEAKIGVSADTIAVCVITNETTRLDCVAVSVVTSGDYQQAVVGERIPTNAPQVSIRASTNLTVSTSPLDHPNCPVCA